MDATGYISGYIFCRFQHVRQYYILYNHQATLATLHLIKSTWSTMVDMVLLNPLVDHQICPQNWPRNRLSRSGSPMCPGRVRPVQGESEVFSFWIFWICFLFWICLDYVLGIIFFGSCCWLMFSCFFLQINDFIINEGLGITMMTMLGWPGKTVLDENICWMTSLVLLNDNKKMYQTEPLKNHDSWFSKLMIFQKIVNPKVILKNHDSLYESLKLLEIASQESLILKIPY